MRPVHYRPTTAALQHHVSSGAALQDNVCAGLTHAPSLERRHTRSCFSVSRNQLRFSLPRPDRLPACVSCRLIPRCSGYGPSHLPSSNYASRYTANLEV